MVKKILASIVILAFVFSCNNETEKSKEVTGEKVVETVKAGENPELVKLDTAEAISNILCQGWVLEDDAEGLEGMSETSAIEIPYRCFYLSTAGTFVKNPRTTFDYGSWIYDDAAKTITLNNTIDKTKDIYKIAKIAADELIVVNVGVSSTTNLKFISQAKRYKNAKDEPFFLENNRWRIKPKSAETDAEIHERLKQNLHFFVLFYKSTLAKEDKIVSFWGLPSCFKWFGGSIFIKKKDELKDDWINCFYNKEQAMKAYAIADKLIEQKYTWPKGERNWLKLNLAVLEQMYKKIDEIH